MKDAQSEQETPRNESKFLESDARFDGQQLPNTIRSKSDVPIFKE